MNKSIFKIAVLNDLIGIELTNIQIDKIIDPITKSKLRNLKKTSDSITKFTDEIFKESDIQEVFGEYCDVLNKVIDDELKDIL